MHGRRLLTCRSWLLLPIAIVLPAEFELTFSRSHHCCITVWRQPERIGLKFKTSKGRYSTKTHRLAVSRAWRGAFRNSGVRGRSGVVNHVEAMRKKPSIVSVWGGLCVVR